MRADLYFLGIDIILILLEHPRYMLAPVMGFKCGDDALIEGLANRRHVGWKKQDQNVFVLETAKATVESEFSYFVFG